MSSFGPACRSAEFTNSNLLTDSFPQHSRLGFKQERTLKMTYVVTDN